VYPKTHFAGALSTPVRDAQILDVSGGCQEDISGRDRSRADGHCVPVSRSS
jgi:hypothetical protein